MKALLFVLPLAFSFEVSARRDIDKGELVDIPADHHLSSQLFSSAGVVPVQTRDQKIFKSPYVTKSGELKFVGYHKPSSQADIGGGQLLRYEGMTAGVILKRKPATGRIKELIYKTEDIYAVRDESGKRSQFMDEERRVVFDSEGNVESVTRCLTGDINARGQILPGARRDCLTTSKEICRDLDLKAPSQNDINKCRDIYKSTLEFHNGTYLRQQKQDLMSMMTELSGSYDINIPTGVKVPDIEVNPFAAFSFLNELREACKADRENGLINWDAARGTSSFQGQIKSSVESN